MSSISQRLILKITLSSKHIFVSSNNLEHAMPDKLCEGKHNKETESV